MSSGLLRARAIEQRLAPDTSVDPSLGAARFATGCRCLRQRPLAVTPTVAMPMVAMVRSAHLVGDDDLYTSVLLSASGCFIARHRAGFAKTARGDAVGCNAAVDQGILHGQGAAL